MFLFKSIDHRQAARSVIVGVSAATLSFILLFVTTSLLGIWYLSSSAIAFTIALCYNFYLQKHWTFKVRGTRLSHGFLPFALVGVVNLALYTTLMYVFVDRVELYYLLAHVAASSLIGIESFIAYRYIFAQPQ